MNYTHEWEGKSRTKYPYTVCEINFTPSKHQKGNYIFARYDNRKEEYVPIYIGEGILLDRYEEAMEEGGCVKWKNPTHYCFHLNSNEQKRKDEEADLIHGNPLCWKENGGCNIIKPSRLLSEQSGLAKTVLGSS